MIYIVRNNKRRIHPAAYLFFAAASGLVYITWLVFIEPSTTLDDMIFEWITSLVSEPWTKVMKAITFLGNYQFLLPANLLLIGLLLYYKQKRSAWRVAVIALSSLGLKLLLKELFHRVRPDNPMIEGIKNFSFPSGHASMGVSFYGVLIWLAIRNIKNKVWRVFTIVLLTFIILMIGFSRIYLRVHYTTDVIAGLCLGACWVCFCLWVTQKIGKRNKLAGDVSEKVGGGS
jgi:membrane-associated phospholipid phosphatase